MFPNDGIFDNRSIQVIYGFFGETLRDLVHLEYRQIRGVDFDTIARDEALLLGFDTTCLFRFSR